MESITNDDLLAAGYPPGPALDAMLAKAAATSARGIGDRKYLMKLLKREFGPPPPKPAMREHGPHLAEAISAESPEETHNLAAVRRQMKELMRATVITAGAIMPDACPAGPGQAVMPVGGVIAAENAIIPSAHSSDICCSMFASFHHSAASVAEALDALSRSTRFGRGHRPREEWVFDPVLDEPVWENRFLSGLRERAHSQLADQGDGNHFAFLGETDVTPELLATLRASGHHDLAAGLAPGTHRVLVTHHGSRSLGAHVFKRGHTAAVKHMEKQRLPVPEELAWLEADSEEGREYWEALQYVARWTKANHAAIHRRFLEEIGSRALATIGNEHNFVWRRGNHYFHGKGATPAWPDEAGRPQLGLIPLNMAEPVLLVLGGDQAEFLSFAPHGAGRNLSRTKLRRRFPDPIARQELLETTTSGIDVRWYCGKPDISESPVAYKSAAAVRAQIDRFGLARIITEIHPLGCIMAGDDGGAWRDQEILTPKQIRQMAHRKERRRVHRDPEDHG